MNGYVSDTQLLILTATDEELDGLLRSAERHPDPEVTRRVRELVVAEREVRQGAS